MFINKKTPFCAFLRKFSFIFVVRGLVLLIRTCAEMTDNSKSQLLTKMGHGGGRLESLLFSWIGMMGGGGGGGGAAGGKSLGLDLR